MAPLFFHVNDLQFGIGSELKTSYQLSLRQAFLFALALHLALAVIYVGIEAIRGDNTYRLRAVPIQFVPPPPIHEAILPPDVDAVPPSRLVIGIPDPVPDTEASPEMTIPTQSEMSQGIAPVVQATGSSQQLIVEAPKEEKIIVPEEIFPAPTDFVPVEEFPKLVSRPAPQYPEMARKAGIEGMVILNILIDQRGKVRDTRVIKGIGAGLDEAAIEHARQTIWTPAIQNNKPVAVWVSYPVRFKLR